MYTQGVSCLGCPFPSKPFSCGLGRWEGVQGERWREGQINNVIGPVIRDEYKVFAQWHHVSGSWLMSDKLVSLRMTRIRSKESACRIRSSCTCKFHSNTAWADHFLHFPHHHHCKITPPLKKKNQKWWWEAWHKLAIMRFSCLPGFDSEDAIKLLCHQRIRPRLQWHITEEQTPHTAAGAGANDSQAAIFLRAQASFKKLWLSDGPLNVWNEWCAQFILNSMSRDWISAQPGRQVTTATIASAPHS